MNLTFTTHHNWDWVVTEGIAQLVSHSASSNKIELIFLSNDGGNRDPASSASKLR